MNIAEAFEEMIRGKKIRQESWFPNCYIYVDGNTEEMLNQHSDPTHLVVDFANLEEWELFQQFGVYRQEDLFIFYDGDFYYFSIDQWSWVKYNLDQFEIDDLDDFEFVLECDDIEDVDVSLNIKRKVKYES